MFTKNNYVLNALFGGMFFLSFVLIFAFANADLKDANEIVKKASENRFGDKSYGVMRMTVVRPKYTRTIEMKNWTLGEKYSMVLITDPAREKGQVFLKRDKEMWNYVPKISRMIKLPPSMMSQGWMGSDFSNDDVVNQNSLIDNYIHKLISSERIDNMDCYKIESTPKKETDVVWGKKITWISKEGFYMLKTATYDEDGSLVRTELASNIKAFGKNKLPSKFTIIPADKPDHKTVFEILQLDFDVKLTEDFFTQANMKRIK
jgi:outer membrane lipoprotein-sorting protein